MTKQPLPSTDPSSGRPTRLVIALAVTSGVLLLAVVALVFLLIGRGTASPEAVPSDTPVPSETPSATPSESPSPEASQGGGAQPPADTRPRFTSFVADLSVECDPTGEQERPEIVFAWSAVNAVEAWYTPSTKDAYLDQYMKFPNPLRGTQADLTDEHVFPCNHRETMDVTITLVGANGERVSHHVVYTDVNWGK